MLYGKTIDHVLEQTVVLSDGSIAALPRDAAAMTSPQGTTLEAALLPHRAAPGAEHADEIDRRYPKVLRRVGGYNLDEFADPAKPVNLAKMMVGSEGTLGVVLEAKLRLVPLPKAKAVMVIEFADLLEALAATPVILRHKPSAVEVMDKSILDNTRQNATLDRIRESVHRGRSRGDACASSSTPTAKRICRRALPRSRTICARASSATAITPKPIPPRRRASGACAKPRSACRWR